MEPTPPPFPAALDPNVPKTFLEIDGMKLLVTVDEKGPIITLAIDKDGVCGKLVDPWMRNMGQSLGEEWKGDEWGDDFYIPAALKEKEYFLSTGEKVDPKTYPMKFFVPELYPDVPPYSCVPESLRALLSLEKKVNAGFEETGCGPRLQIVICTSNPCEYEEPAFQKFVEAKTEWFRTHVPELTGRLLFSKKRKDKSNFSFTAIVDDAGYNHDKLLPLGIKGYLVNRPYNTTYAGNVTRVNELSDAVPLLYQLVNKVLTASGREAVPTPILVHEHSPLTPPLKLPAKRKGSGISQFEPYWKLLRSSQKVEKTLPHDGTEQQPTR